MKRIVSSLIIISSACFFEGCENRSDDSKPPAGTYIDTPFGPVLKQAVPEDAVKPKKVIIQREARFDEEWKPQEASKDLKADIALMWKTVPLKDEKFNCSPVSAINASQRVFKAVDLKGKTRNEIIALLGDNRTSNDSGYNFPFYPAPKGTMVYRFDCGNYGFQYNITFGPDGKATSVETLGIE